MALFPDSETKKRFMKTGLPIMLGIAWAPIIWMLFISSLGPLLFALTGSWTATQVVVLLAVLLATYFLLRFFMRVGTKFYTDNQ
ncbi:MAG: hypothetical protein HKK67_03780 [Chlorobiaceae bacterium]|nr:hypothetical protein [Chlorobiaceae bacterium]